MPENGMGFLFLLFLSFFCNASKKMPETLKFLDYVQYFLTAFGGILISCKRLADDAFFLLLPVSPKRGKRDRVP